MLRSALLLLLVLGVVAGPASAAAADLGLSVRPGKGGQLLLVLTHTRFPHRGGAPLCTEGRSKPPGTGDCRFRLLPPCPPR
jgi:hypothetical protein